MLIQLMQPDFIFDDERGSLRQLVHEGYSQFNIVFSKKGVFRGDHYHRENKEIFYVVNGFLELIVSKDGIVENYTFKEGDMFLVPPYVMHSFKYKEDSLLVAMYDLGVEYEDGTKDIHTEYGKNF